VSARKNNEKGLHSEKAVPLPVLHLHWAFTVEVGRGIGLLWIQGLYTVYNGAGVQSTVAVLVWPRTMGVDSLHMARKTATTYQLLTILKDQKNKMELTGTCHSVLLFSTPFRASGLEAMPAGGEAEI
jgi:hypothetical protein